MKLQMVLKQGFQEVARVTGCHEVSNAQLMKVTQCENMLEELLGYRAHIIPFSAPILKPAEEQEEFEFTENDE